MNITLDKLIKDLTALRERSPLKGDTVVCICEQNVSYIPVVGVILDADQDGEVVLIVPSK